MKTFSALSLLLSIVLLLNCSRNNDEPSASTNDVIGMYLSKKYENSEINKFTVQYGTRPNFQNMQYTSEDTKSTEVNEPILNLKMDLYLPPNPNAQRKPLLIMIHGGGFSGGDKKAWDAEAYSYATAGYICASVNYRLTKQGGNQSPQLRLFAVQCALEDSQNAIRFLKKNAAEYSIDPTRIVVFGGSAGGVLSLLNAVEYDTAFGANDYTGFSSKTQGSISTGASLINDDPANQPGLIRFDATDSPALMFHAREYDSGGNGYTWTQNAVPTQAAINNSGNTCTLVAQPNMTHTVSLNLGGTYWNDLKPFLWEKLRLSEL